MPNGVQVHVDNSHHTSTRCHSASGGEIGTTTGASVVSWLEVIVACSRVRTYRVYHAVLRAVCILLGSDISCVSRSVACRVYIVV